MRDRHPDPDQADESEDVPDQRVPQVAGTHQDLNLVGGQVVIDREQGRDEEQHDHARHDAEVHDAGVRIAQDALRPHPAPNHAS